MNNGVGVNGEEIFVSAGSARDVVRRIFSGWLEHAVRQDGSIFDRFLYYEDHRCQIR